MTRLVPTPNIQTNLRSTRDRHSSMDSLLIPSAILIKIGPKDRGAFPRLESHSLFRSLPTLDKLAPLLTLRRLNTREIGSTTDAFGRDVDHESAHSP